MLAAPVAVPAGAETRPDAASAVAPIKRFIQVSPQLYRGGQPDREGFEYLKELGIRTVVSFRNDDDERSIVESLGMNFVHIPVTFRPFGGDMPEAAVAKFLSVVDNPASGPVFVHCRRGADRTGAFVGLYRMLRQGWALDKAYDEARDVGMRWWYVDVKDELKDLGRALKSATTASTSEIGS